MKWMMGLYALLWDASALIIYLLYIYLICYTQARQQFSVIAAFPVAQWLAANGKAHYCHLL